MEDDGNDGDVSGFFKLEEEYNHNNTITNQSRTTNPAWLYKDLEQNHRYILLEDPQKRIPESTILVLNQILHSPIKSGRTHKKRFHL